MVCFPAIIDLLMEVSELLLASIYAVSGAVNMLSACILPMPCLIGATWDSQGQDIGRSTDPTTCKTRIALQSCHCL